ncbi:related to Replication factor C subunit 1 [Hanseniaspora guilliermondii]|uniref:Replication factor C subunit 1 n=1 Tax=Hanseniaspora guilliermondii TaxID=56406 RepID=A0A1L0CNZ1_9ASCO|nr:related to Replication factor C subunit 1 [Hanseniaspora guilliermondii]
MSSKGNISKFFKPRGHTKEVEEVSLLSSDDEAKIKSTNRVNVDLDSSSDGEGEDIQLNIAPKSDIQTKKTYANVHELLNDIESVDLDNITTKVVDFKSFIGKSQDPNQSNMSIVDEDSFANGADDCLLGLTIVFTGVLPTLEREAAENIAKKYGARVTKSISGKTSLVVLGDEAGPSKVEKIKKLKIKCINEDGFKQLINGSPETGGSSELAKKAMEKRLKDQEKIDGEIKRQLKEQEQFEKLEREKHLSNKTNTSKQDPSDYLLSVDDESKLWTTKYAPKSMNDICGNKTLVLRLQTWLSNWDSNYKKDFKYPGKDGNGIFRAAMLSGPPGIGKTTTAHLVARSLGYEVVEKNASDVRSKSQLNDNIKSLLGGTSVNSYFEHTKQELNNNKNLKKFVLIMDEVDGMSSGDRGGVGALTSFIRKTKTPIILICNERRIPKMRPFDRICLELSFRRPDARAVTPRLMAIAQKEKFKLDPSIIEQLTAMSGGDLRLMINILNMSYHNNNGISRENMNELKDSANKDVSIKIFDITAQLFNGSIYGEIGSNRFPLWKKMELYFSEYQFTSLMIQENYLSCKPSNIPKGKTHLQLVSEAADDISNADVLDRNIKTGEQLWGLLPAHAIMSSIAPASKVAGIPGRINFAGWLGQNSTTGKFVRLLQDLYYHSKICTSGNKSNFRTEYIPTLKQVLLLPLLANGSESIDEVIKRLDTYYLSKDDWDTVMTFLIGPQETSAQLKKIPTTVKSAFTRKYNGMKHPVSLFHTATAVTSSGQTKAQADVEEAIEMSDVEDEEDKKSEDEDLETSLKKDKLLSISKSKKRPAAKTSGPKAVKKRKV